MREALWVPLEGFGKHLGSLGEALVGEAVVEVVRGAVVVLLRVASFSRGARARALSTALHRTLHDTPSRGWAIGRTGRSDALAIHFRTTQLWSVRDASAEVIPSKLFLRALREAELPKAVSRATLSRALSTLATDPENLAEVIETHADDEPLVTAAIAWLKLAQLIGSRDESVAPS